MESSPMAPLPTLAPYALSLYTLFLLLVVGQMLGSLGGSSSTPTLTSYRAFLSGAEVTFGRSATSVW